MPSITVEYYRPLKPQSESRTFAQILTEIHGLPINARKILDAEPAAILSLDAEPDGSGFTGEVAKVRMRGLPHVVNVTTVLAHELNLPASDGLGESTHFLYNQNIDILAVQKNAHARAGTIRRLVNELANNSYTFQMIFARDALQQFQRMNSVRKVMYKIARPHDVSDQPRPSVRDAVSITDEFDGVDIEVTVSVGKSKSRRLSMETVRGLVASFTGGDLRRLSITGAMEDEESGAEIRRTIDFSRWQLLYSREVDSSDRILDANGCKLVLREAIRHHRQFLERFSG